MPAAIGSRQIAIFGLLLNFLCAPYSRGQDAPIRQAADSKRNIPEFSTQNCASRLSDARLSGFRVRDAGDGFFSTGFADYRDVPRYREASCATAFVVGTRPPLKTDAASPCPATPLASDSPAGHCASSSKSIAPESASSDLPGVEVRRARAEILEILRSQNSCSEWFGGKDSAVGSTFESLGFLIDRQGPEGVLAVPMKDSTIAIRQPYVARTTQDGGANTSITINANGAFYRSLASFQRFNPDGGPNQFYGGHWLTVGGYGGNTLQAQILTLLHELGHVIDLLPEDSDGLDGRSARNTSEVLRHCRSQIESSAKHVREMAKK